MQHLQRKSYNESNRGGDTRRPLPNHFMATSKKTKIRIAFGQTVRSRRHKIGLTIEELAEAADLHHNYIGSVERGERNIALENIVALAKALKCSAKDLMPE